MKTVETNKLALGDSVHSPICYNVGGKVPLISQCWFVGLDNLKRVAALVRGTLLLGLKKEASSKTAATVDEL